VGSVAHHEKKERRQEQALPISHFYEFEQLKALALGAISPQGHVL